MWYPGDIEQYRDIPTYKGGDDFITSAIIQQIFPTITLNRCELLAEAFNDSCKKYGLNKPGIFHEFVATCGEESANFTVFEENLNYKAERIVAVWPKRFPTVVSAKIFEHNPKKLANYVYANRNGNGSFTSGDGWNNRGGGAIMITGLDMYKKYASYIAEDIEKVRDLVRNDLGYAIDSACWVFAIDKKLIDEAESDDFKTITLRINGGLTNFEEREAILSRAKIALPIT